MGAHKNYDTLDFRKATILPVLRKINFHNMQVSIGIQRANIKENVNDVSNLCTYKSESFCCSFDMMITNRTEVSK